MAIAWRGNAGRSTATGASDRRPGDIVAGMYLGILSRFPTASESSTAEAYFQSGAGKRQATVDLAWALMNSTEFLYRH